MRFRLALLCMASLASTAFSAKILGIFHIPAYSHHQLGNILLRELARRGHEVTAITAYEDKTEVKNYKQVVLTGAVEETEKLKMDMYNQLDMGVLPKLLMLDMMGLDFVEKTLNHTNVQTLLKSDEQFDLVIIEEFINAAFGGFCHHYKAHCVILSTLGGSRWTNPKMGNPGSPSYVPDLYLSYSSSMTFCERFYNSIVYVSGMILTHVYTNRKQNEMLQNYFPGAPHLYDLLYNNSLMLLNSHVSTNPAVPYVPNMIEIGGYHISPSKKLPADLQRYMEDAKEGVIYFSMGSNLKSKDMGEDKRDAILKAFSKLKQKVLWKWEKESMPGLPPNVRLEKWLPQQDILAHPNLKIFITHGGLLSTIETIYHGVPIVGIPVFGDQEMNIANAEISGYGIGVPYKTLTAEALGKALNDILNNKNFTENAKRRSKIMHDQPMKPLDRAVFWIEYVLRHDGAPHLRTAALNLSWYQYLLLDVVALVGVIALIGFLLFCLTVKLLFFRRREIKKEKPGKKKN